MPVLVLSEGVAMDEGGTYRKMASGKATLPRSFTKPMKHSEGDGSDEATREALREANQRNEHAALVNEAAGLGYNRDLAEALDLPKLRETVRFLKARLEPEAADDPSPMPNDSPTVDDSLDQEMREVARNHRAFAEGKDSAAMRLALDGGPSHDPNGTGVRARSRDEWAKWTSISEKDADALLSDMGVSKAQLDFMDVNKKKQEAFRLTSLSKDSPEEFDRAVRDYIRGNGGPKPSHDGPPGQGPTQHSSTGPAMAFSEGASFNSFWQRHGEKLERVGESRDQWAQTFASIGPKERQRLLSGR